MEHLKRVWQWAFGPREPAEPILLDQWLEDRFKGEVDDEDYPYWVSSCRGYAFAEVTKDPNAQYWFDQVQFTFGDPGEIGRVMRAQEQLSRHLLSKGGLIVRVEVNDLREVKRALSQRGIDFTSAFQPEEGREVAAYDFRGNPVRLLGPKVERE